VNMGTEAFVAG